MVAVDADQALTRLIGGVESKLVGEIKPKPDTADNTDIFWRRYTDEGNAL